MAGVPSRASSRRGRRDELPETSLLRRFGRMLMLRGESVAKSGAFAEAALQFERAAWAYEVANQPLAAAEAALELGRCLLYLNRGESIPALAGRIENLAKEAGELPAGGLVTMRVWAEILRRGQREPGPFLHLLRLRRCARRTETPPPRPRIGGLPRISGLLRETALLRFGRVPTIRKALDYVAELLSEGADSQPLDPELLGESVIRAKLRAMGRELRHLEDFAAEVTEPLQRGSVDGLTLDPADLQLRRWLAERQRDIMRLAELFERQVGPVPEAVDQVACPSA